MEQCKSGELQECNRHAKSERNIMVDRSDGADPFFDEASLELHYQCL